MKRHVGAISKTTVILVLSLVVVAILGVLFYNFVNPSPQSTATTPTTPLSTPTTTTSTTTTTTPRPQVILSGAGASFLAPQMFEWARLFKDVSGIKVEYQSVGSGAGRDMFFNKVVHFAGSDPPLSKELYNKYKGEVMQIPVVVGAVAIVYNIPDLPREATLCLSGEVLALIYKGEIKYWNDDRIIAINPELKNVLPREEIIAVHRSDSSGTTSVFTTYLNKVAPSMWSRELVGFTVDWPVDRVGRGVGGKGNEGVTQVVKTTPYSIGYVELSYAVTQNLPIAAIRNSEGVCVKPTVETVQSTLVNTARQLPQSPLDDWSDVLYTMLNAEGRNSYPIISFSYIFVYRKYPDAQVVQALKEFIKWILTDGQKHMVPGYLPLPREVAEIGLKAVELLEVG